MNVYWHWLVIVSIVLGSIIMAGDVAMRARRRRRKKQVREAALVAIRATLVAIGGSGPNSVAPGPNGDPVARPSRPAGSRSRKGRLEALLGLWILALAAALAVASRPTSAQQFTRTDGDIGPLWSRDDHFSQGILVTADFNGEMYRFGIDDAVGPGGRNMDLIDQTPNAVPEPSTLVLAMMAMVGLGTFLAARSR
jgi:hypothetical protein